jgi:uncharacterized protein
MTRASESRRRATRMTWLLRVAVVAFLAVCVRGFVWEPAQLVERDHRLDLPRWPQRCDGLRLDVVADTHTGSPHNGLDNLDRWVQRLIESDADAVLMAGDYVILSVFLGSYVPADQIAERLARLAATKPVYAVLGNHDWWKGGALVHDAFEAAGIHMVDNRAVRVQARDCGFWIAGLGDLLEGSPDVDGTFAMIDDDAPVLVLTHEPDLFPRVPPRAVLTIAGHTHGGQIDLWPFRRDPASFVSRSFRLKWHVLDGGRHLFVTPGIGTSILPMRLGVPPEISRLTLGSAQ